MRMIFDRSVVMDKSKRVITDEGYLIVPAKIARSGFQDYYAGELELEGRDLDEKLVIYRPPTEVFKKDSMQSFAGKPVTNDHPPELVDINNIKKYQVGFSGETVTKDSDNNIETILTINDKQAVADIESGKCEVSNGYTADIEMKPGHAEGRAYDGIQKNIKGNHIAIVEKGRAGKQCKLSDNKPYNNNGDKTMKKFLVDGVSYEAPEQVVEIVGKLQDSKAQLTDKINTMDADQKTAIDGLKADNKKAVDTLQAKLDDAVSKVLTDAQIEQKADERSKLVYDAKKVCKDVDSKGKSNLEVMTEVVKSKGVDVADKSPDYILARFEGFVDAFAVIGDGSQEMKFGKKKGEYEDDDEDEDDKMKKKQMSDSENAWKKNKGDK